MEFHFEDIKAKLKIKNIDEISKWDHSYFIEKLKSLKNEKIAFYKHKVKTKPIPP